MNRESGKILNPKTNRWVSKTGSIGRSIIATAKSKASPSASPKSKSPKTSPNSKELPNNVLLEIANRSSPKTQRILKKVNKTLNTYIKVSPAVPKVPQVIVNPSDVEFFNFKASRLHTTDLAQENIATFANRLLHRMVVDYIRSKGRTYEDFISPIIIATDKYFQNFSVVLHENKSVQYSRVFDQVQGVDFDCNNFINILMKKIAYANKRMLDSPYNTDIIDNYIWEDRVLEDDEIFGKLYYYVNNYKDWKTINM